MGFNAIGVSRGARSFVDCPFSNAPAFSLCGVSLESELHSPVMGMEEGAETQNRVEKKEEKAVEVYFLNSVRWTLFHSFDTE